LERLSAWTETSEINTDRNNYRRTNYAAGGASTGKDNALIFGGKSQPIGIACVVWHNTEQLEWFFMD
jgi:hypothetical protein